MGSESARVRPVGWVSGLWCDCMGQCAALCALALGHGPPRWAPGRWAQHTCSPGVAMCCAAPTREQMGSESARVRPVRWVSRRCYDCDCLGEQLSAITRQGQLDHVCSAAPISLALTNGGAHDLATRRGRPSSRLELLCSAAQGRNALDGKAQSSSINPSHRTYANTLRLHLFPSG